MSVRMTQRSFKVSTSGPVAFSSLFSSGTSISSSAFSWVSSSSRLGLNTSMNLAGGLGGAGSMGTIKAIQRDPSLLSSMKEVDPNIQAMRSQEKEQIKSLNNRFASFINKVLSLQQQSKILETKWSLLQQQKTTHSNMDNMIEAYISNLQWQLETLAQEKLRLGTEFGNIQGLEDLKNKYEGKINERTEMENKFVLIRKDVDEAYMNKVELKSLLEGLTNEINFYRQLYDEKILELQSQISNTSMVLSMDNSRSLDLDSIIAEVKAQYKEIANHSCAEVETIYKIKYQELQALAGKHGDKLHCTKMEISETNRNISRIQAEINGLQGQRASLEATIKDAKQHGKLAIKNAQAKVAELEAALRAAKQDMAQQLHKYQELMNIRLARVEIVTNHKLLEGKESQLESGMQNMSIHTKITSSYSGGLSPAYRNFNYGLGFQASLGSGRSCGSFSHTSTSSSKTVAAKNIETHDGKLVSESSDVQVNDYCSPSYPPNWQERSSVGEQKAQETHLRSSSRPQLTLGAEVFTAWRTTSYPCPQLKAKSSVFIFSQNKPSAGSAKNNNNTDNQGTHTDY
ncbi:LOW QUALITY PROTEIN: keratin, type II cytoskeletal 8-like [Glossophaga mutica]